MHYKNGRLAQNGDRIVNVEVNGYHPPVAGILYNARAEGGNDCTGRIAMPTPTDPVADLKNCLHIDDIAAAMIPDTSPKAGFPAADLEVEKLPSEAATICNPGELQRLYNDLHRYQTLYGTLPDDSKRRPNKTIPAEMTEATNSAAEVQARTEPEAKAPPQAEFQPHILGSDVPGRPPISSDTPQAGFQPHILGEQRGTN